MGVVEWLGIAALTLPFPAWVVIKITGHDSDIAVIKERVCGAIDAIKDELEKHYKDDADTAKLLNDFKNVYIDRASSIDGMIGKMGDFEKKQDRILSALESIAKK